MRDPNATPWRDPSVPDANVQRADAIPDADADRIGFMGHSLGRQEALFATAVDPRIKVGVSSCGFSSYEAIIGTGQSGKNIRLRSFDTGHELSREMMDEASRWLDTWLMPGRQEQQG